MRPETIEKLRSKLAAAEAAEEPANKILLKTCRAVAKLVAEAEVENDEPLYELACDVHERLAFIAADRGLRVKLIDVEPAPE